MTPEHIYIGYDKREDIAAQVCKFSIQRRSSVPLLTEHVSWLSPGYDRPYKIENGQCIDKRDGRPFSTAFTFARFLVPWLQDYGDWALFCDCDFLFLEDVAKLFALRDESKAVMVVKHLHLPSVTRKMDGQDQSAYPRKNWSSLMLWNCGHPSNKALTPDVVNHMPGRMLHGFKWLEDDEIGELPPSWNHLADYTLSKVRPKAIHFTEGGPWFDEYKDCQYADLWNEEKEFYEAKRLKLVSKEMEHGASEQEASHGAI